MTADRTESIRRLYDNFMAAVRQPDGSLIIEPSETKGLLVKNNLYPHMLTLDELSTAAVCLSKTLCGPSLILQNSDLYLFWNWCAEILTAPFIPNRPGARSPLFGLNNYALQHLTIATYGVACDRFDGVGTGIFLSQAAPSLSNSLQRSLQFLAFPLLEGLLRVQCSEYVTGGGDVKKDFTITDKGKPVKDYKSSKKARLNNIGHTLRLFRQEVARDSLKEYVDEFLDIMNEFKPFNYDSFQERDKWKDGYGAIAHWRNSTLHGEGIPHQSEFVVLNLISLIALNAIDGDFSDYLKTGTESASSGEQEVQDGEEEAGAKGAAADLAGTG